MRKLFVLGLLSAFVADALRKKAPRTSLIHFGDKTLVMFDTETLAVVRRFFASPVRPKLRRDLADKEPAVKAPEGATDTYGLLVGEARTILPRLLETAVAAGASVSGVEIVEPDLEAVFLHLTGRALRD